MAICRKLILDILGHLFRVLRQRLSARCGSNEIAVFHGMFAAVPVADCSERKSFRFTTFSFVILFAFLVAFDGRFHNKPC